jgi:hypothetical protein
LGVRDGLLPGEALLCVLIGVLGLRGGRLWLRRISGRLTKGTAGRERLLCRCGYGRLGVLRLRRLLVLNRLRWLLVLRWLLILNRLHGLNRLLHGGLGLPGHLGLLRHLGLGRSR